jgi:hypothetical protein
MMKFNFRDLQVPPDGYRWTSPDGRVILASNRVTWYEKIKEDYVWQNRPLPDNWKELAEDQMCRILPAGWAKYETGETSQGIVNNRVSIGYLFRGMEVMYNIVKEGQDAFVDQDTAERRALVCQACPANIAVDACLPCMAIANKVMDIIGPERKTKSDHVLRTCSVCGCDSKTQVHVKAEILAKGVTGEQMRQFRLLGHCWKGQEIDALPS